ncbi:MAG TPA: hypothetical protein VNA14_04275 [Mycobacteriales bacterium]|nr:hypothetical protein [Mycobacteriales bacterium]
MRLAMLPLAVAVAVAGLVTPSHAAPRPQPRTETVPFRDATPDPTGMAVGSDGHCSGLLPREAPHKFTAPARGTLKVTLGGFTGEWALHLLNEKGTVLSETDTTGYESLTVKVKKGAVVGVLPCNLVGTPDGTITLVFTYA